MSPVEIKKGDSTIILAMPHTGTFVPDEIWNTLNALGQKLEDTDWHIHKLYENVLPQATTVRATFHRYVIDANRDPSGASLYPGQNTTELCPTTDFEGRALYYEGQAPNAKEIERRCHTFHTPYHMALQTEIKRIKALHGLTVLYDCHSIQSQKPYLFEGRLPDFNIGTNNGLTCDERFEKDVTAICKAARGYSSIVNGRFKGGWTTRHYGQPKDGVHAIQMELAQSTYMEEMEPWTYLPNKADLLRPHLQNILQTLEHTAIEIIL